MPSYDFDKWEFFKAVIAKLRADLEPGIAVYETAPKEIQRDFVTVFEADFRRTSGQTTEGWEVDLEVHAVARSESFKRVCEIDQSVSASLTGSGLVVSGATAHITADAAQFFRDRDGETTAAVINLNCHVWE